MIQLHTWRTKFIVILLVTISLLFQLSSSLEINSPRPDSLEQTIIDIGNDTIAQSIIADRYCPCGCGNFLPGSPNSPSCFGCSVGKAEISRVHDRLAAGKTVREIIHELDGKILVDLFSDYTNAELPDIWRRVKRIAGEYHQYRVVLRTLGATEDDRRAIKLVECARTQGTFTAMNEVLINHQGPWDEATLIKLAEEQGLATDDISECLGTVDVTAQISKDRQHADLLAIKNFPAVVVNKELVPASEEGLQKGIRAILFKGSI